MNSVTLFRPEALAHTREQPYGVLFMNTPVQYKIVTFGVALVLVCLALFILLASFSEHVTVKGYINTTTGMVRVYPARVGVVLQSAVHQGQHVHQGELLFLVDTSSDGMSATQHDSVLQSLEAQRDLMMKEIGYKKEQLKALKSLLDKHFISKTAYHATDEQLNALAQAKHRLEMSMINHKNERTYEIRASRDGVVSSVMVQAGQYLHLDKPLAMILPDDAQWVAELCVPVTDSGFLTMGRRVRIRYDAYPYERYGFVNAVIQQVSDSVVMEGDELIPIHVNAPYYKVSARLDTPFIMLHGKAQKIKQGMTFSAVMVGNKKKVWQWILDPLYR